MKKIDQSISKNYLPLRLDLDDLHAIEEVLKEATKEYQIDCGDFQFDSVDELAGKLKDATLRELEIKSLSPYLRIELTKLFASVYVGSNEIDSAGLFHKVDSILRKARIPLFFLYSYYSVWSLNIFIILLEFIHRSPVLDWLFWGMLLGVLRVGYVRLTRHSSVIVASTRLAGSFFRRKKDDLLLAVISGLVGALLGIAGTILVNYLKK